MYYTMPSQPPKSAELAGDRLVEGQYQPIEIKWSDESHCRGYSEALGLYLCWEEGELRFYDPVSEDYLRTHYEEAARADRAEAELRRLRERLAALDDNPSGS